MKVNKKEVGVVFMALFFLFMNLGAVSNKSHVHAKRIICKSNLEQCYRAMIAFTNDNNGNFPDADHDNGPHPDSHGLWWIMPMLPYIENQNIFLCPIANKHPEDVSGSYSFVPISNDQCWGSRQRCDDNNANGEMFWSSYGPNGWLMNPLEDGSVTIQRWGAPIAVPNSSFWGKMDRISTPSNVPFYLDSRWLDAWPHDTNVPHSAEFGVYDGQGYMNHFVQNRHGNGVTMAVFTDGSARPVGLKELWTLKWHGSFDTEGQWTIAGGASPEQWPAWMQGFKDY